MTSFPAEILIPTEVKWREGVGSCRLNPQTKRNDETVEVERYTYATVTDFYQRRTAMQMFLDLSTGTQKSLILSMLGEEALDYDRMTLRRAIMVRLCRKDGYEVYERIRLAYLRQHRETSASERQ